ncbi:hypothetical protein QTP88_001180 [Uroleucon formosanum]
MVSEGRRLEEQDRNADNNNFIIPYYREVNNIDTNSSDESERETESASESENDYETELERETRFLEYDHLPRKDYNTIDADNDDDWVKVTM